MWTRAHEPLIPPGKPGGGKRRVAIREVINGVNILSTGCQWRALIDYLGLWNWDGTLDRIHHALARDRSHRRRRSGGLALLASAYHFWRRFSRANGLPGRYLEEPRPAS